MALTAFKKGMKGTLYDNFVDGKPALTSEALSEVAAAVPAVDITDTPMVGFSHGFVNALDTTQPFGPEAEWQWGTYTIVAYRFDRRNINAAVLEREAKKTSDKMLSEKKGIPLTKSEKISAVEQARMRLLPKTPVSSKTVLITLDEKTHILGIWGASEKERDIIIDNIARRCEEFRGVYQVSMLDVAQLLRKEDFEEKQQKLEEILKKESAAPEDSQGLANMATWIWFLTETNPGGEMNSPSFNSPYGTFFMSLDGDTLHVGELDQEGKATDVLTSKESDHGHIRYALWKDKRCTVAGKFVMAIADVGNVCLTLDATRPGQFAADTGSIFEGKAIERRVKVPAKFCSVKMEEDPELRAAYDTFLSNVNDNQENAIFAHIGAVHASVMNLAYLSDLYMTARISPKRWKGTWESIQEWLMAYVPECERIQQTAPE